MVVPRASRDDRGGLASRSAQLAEQDPLINVRQDDTRQEISVSLYGEVQKEVIQATLANDFGLDVSFRETTTICIERADWHRRRRSRSCKRRRIRSPPRSGCASSPPTPESGVQFRLDVDPRVIPLFIYKTRDRFVEAMTQYSAARCKRVCSAGR